MVALQWPGDVARHGLMTRESGATMGENPNRKRGAVPFELLTFLFVDDTELDRIFGETTPPRKQV